MKPLIKDKQKTNKNETEKGEKSTFCKWTTTAYRVYNLTKKEVIVTHDIVFDENIKSADVHTVETTTELIQPDPTLNTQINPDTIIVDTSPLDDLDSNSDDNLEDDDIQATP